MERITLQVSMLDSAIRNFCLALSSLGFFEKVWLIVTSTNHSEKLSDALLTVARFIKYGYLNANPAAAEFIADQLIHCLGASGFNVRRQVCPCLSTFLHL